MMETITFAQINIVRVVETAEQRRKAWNTKVNLLDG